MSGGGSGGSGTQQYNWNEHMEQPWVSAIDYATALRDRPYEQYQGPRIAGLNQDQSTSMDTIRNMVNGGGLSVTNAANSQGEDTLNDMYLTGDMRNPYADQANPYSGYGPMFGQQLQGQLDDLTGAYQRGTAADTTRMFNLSGAFGGSAHQNAVANNQAVLGKQLNNTIANAYQNQFNQSAGLAENRLNRGAAAYEGERGRQIGAMGQGTAAQQNFFQGANQLMGVGDIQRGLTQDYYNQNLADWTAQRNYAPSQLDYFTGILGRAQGGISPNVTTTSSGYQASPYSQLLGAGLLGYGALSGR